MFLILNIIHTHHQKISLWPYSRELFQWCSYDGHKEGFILTMSPRPCMISISISENGTHFDSTSICFCDLSFSITHPLRDLLCIEHIPVISRWSVHFLVGLPWHCMIRARLPFLYKNSQAAVNTSFKDTFFRAHSLNAYWGVSKLFSGILPA